MGTKGRIMEETITPRHSVTSAGVKVLRQSTDETVWAVGNVEGYKDEDNTPTPLLKTPVVSFPWLYAKCMPSHYIFVIASLHSCTEIGNKVENTKTNKASKKIIMGWDIGSLLKQKWRLCTWKEGMKKIPNNEYFIPHFSSTGDIQPLPGKQIFGTHSSCLRRQTS